MSSNRGLKKTVLSDTRGGIIRHHRVGCVEIYLLVVSGLLLLECLDFVCSVDDVGLLSLVVLDHGLDV